MVEYTLVNLLTVLLAIGFLGYAYRVGQGQGEDLALFLVSVALGIGLFVAGLVPNAVFKSMAALLGIRLEAVAVLVVSNSVLFVVITFLFNRVGTLKADVSKLNEELSLLRQQVEEDD